MGLELVIDENIVLDFMTYDAAGLPADADSLPTIEIYENTTDTAIAYAPTVVSRSLDGHYRVTIAPTAANGFTAGNAYHVYVLATIATDDYKTKLDWAVARTYSIDSLQAAIDSVLAAIQGQTDLIPADPATETTLAAIQAKTDLIPADPATETTLAAIQAKTDLIPADPATETTLATIPGAVWEEAAASHVTAGSMGELLNGAGNPWSIAVSGNTTAGTFGEAVESTRSQAAMIPADPATETTLAAIQAQTDLIPADPATETSLAAIQADVDILFGGLIVAYTTVTSNAGNVIALNSLDGSLDINGCVAVIPGAGARTIVAHTANQITVDAAFTTTPSGDIYIVAAPAVWGASMAEHAISGTMGEAVGLADDIKAQTDLIPADPATETSVGYVPSLVWEELSAAHVTADTMGELLNGAGNPWSIAVAGNTTAGTFGEAVSFIPADPATETTLAAIQAQTDLIPADPATETSVAATPAAVWDVDLSTHTTAGTAGDYLNYVDNIPADVWGAATEDNDSAGTMGEAVGQIQTQAALIPADPATETTLAAIKAQTDLIPADPATITAVEAVPSGVWQELAASHVDAGTMGELLNGAGNPWSIAVTGNTDAGTFGEAVDAIKAQTDLIPADPATETTVSAIPDLVWDVTASGHVTANTMGEAINMIDDIKAKTDLIPADPATETTLAVIQGQTDLIPADTATEGTLAVIQAQTDHIPVDPATETHLDAIDASLATISSDVWDVVSASHLTAGTTGKRLADAAAAGNPWSTTVAGNTDAGTFGELLGDTLPADLADIYDDTHTTGVAVKDGAISSDSFTVGTVDGVESGLLEQIRQLWRRFFKKTVYNKTGNNIKTYADDGTTVVTTQTTANSSTEQSQGPAS